ncbi:hypothetical protein D3C86_2115750 [compost metagenome]
MRSPRSWPAQKPRPAPVISRQRTSAFWRTCLRASRTSLCIAGLKLLSCSGRFRVRVATPCSMVKRMCSKLMKALSIY